MEESPRRHVNLDPPTKCDRFPFKEMKRIWWESELRRHAEHDPRLNDRRSEAVWKCRAFGCVEARKETKLSNKVFMVPRIRKCESEGKSRWRPSCHTRS